MTLMEQFANPSLFENLTMGERLTGATVTMLMGLGITFSILIIIWIFITIMSKTVGSAKKEEKAAAPAPAPAPAAPVQAAEAKGEEIEDAELIAVIAAAIAAAQGGSVFVPTLKIKKITRISGQTNAWNSAGLGECIDSRRM